MADNFDTGIEIIVMISDLPSFETIRSTLQTRGIVTLNVGPSFDEEQMTMIARNLGRPRQALRNSGVIDYLTPKSEREASANSISSRFGLGEFPLHTDDAVSEYPAKYLLLHNHKHGELAPTTLLDTRELVSEFQNEIAEAVFYVENGRKSFTSTIFDKSTSFIRFDANIFRPSGLRSDKLIRLFLNRISKSKIVEEPWEIPSLLILDNHRFLHGRREISNRLSGGRVLFRILVEETI